MGTIGLNAWSACKSMVSACLADWLISFCNEGPGNYFRTREDQTCCQKAEEETSKSETANAVSDSQKPLGVADEKGKEKNRRQKNNRNTKKVGDLPNF